MSYRFVDSFQAAAGSGWNSSILILLEMVYVIQVRGQLSSSSWIRMDLIHPDPARKLSTNLYDIYHC
jgi:hypothetical protein